MTYLNNSEAKGLIQGWLYKGSTSVSYHAVHLAVPDWILLCYQPPAPFMLRSSLCQKLCTLLGIEPETLIWNQGQMLYVTVQSKRRSDHQTLMLDLMPGT